MKVLIVMVLMVSMAGCAANVGQLDKSAAKVSPTPAGVATAALSHDLAAWARANNDPAAVVISARVLASAPAKPMEGVSKKTKVDEKVDAPEKQAKEVTPETLVAEAKALASGNEKMLTIVESLRPPRGRRGAWGGAKRHVDKVNALSTDSYTITFRGGELAQVAVIGDGDTDLDLYVNDENGNLIGSDTDYTDRCLVEWVPKWTGPFRIRIKNRGRVYNRYTLLTN